jgi:hypothetical protein
MSVGASVGKDVAGKSASQLASQQVSNSRLGNCCKV